MSWGRDVYYERGRKPKESIIKYEATRSEGDYPEEGATRALMRYRRERHVLKGGGTFITSEGESLRKGMCVCVFITGEGEPKEGKGR